jgi:hypothetical protein
MVKVLGNAFIMILITGLTVGFVWADEPTQVGEVIGLFPSINQQVTTAGGVAGGVGWLDVDTYEVKCTQSSRYMDIVVDDTGTDDDCFSATLIGYVPASMLGRAVSSEDACSGTSAFIYLTRPGSEGTMKALLSVYAYFTLDDGSISYTVTADCYSNNEFLAGGDGQRTTSLVLKQNQ